MRTNWLNVSVLASQLRSRVNTVEELVKLGHQLERDYEQQLRYDCGRMGPKHQATSQRPYSNHPTEKIPVQCWRCRGQHPPGKCPHYTSPQSPQTSGPQYSTSSKQPYHPKSGGHPSNNSVAQQLVVPLCIDAWSGKAIVDTGASYTLIHENLMRQLTSPDQLQPWCRGPLYLLLYFHPKL